MVSVVKSVTNQQTSSAKQRLPGESKSQINNSQAKYRLFPSTRCSIVLLAFLGLMFSYMMRSNLSAAIVCMVKRNATDETSVDLNSTFSLPGSFNISAVGDNSPISSMNTTTNTNYSSISLTNGRTNITRLRRVREVNSTENGSPGSNVTRNHQIKGEFDWDRPLEGKVLSSFFYGYLCGQIIGGYCADRFGGKIVYFVAVLGSGILTLLTPVAARINVWLLIVVRVFLGLFQAATFPSCHTLLSVWSPPTEVSLLSGIVYSGPQFGNVLGYPLVTFLCDHGFNGGWPSVFYVIGSGTVAWCLLWFILGSNRPSTHITITQPEREYIVKSLEATMGKEQGHIRVPWMRILKSLPVWAAFVGHFAGDWGAYSMMTLMPTFLNDVIGLELKSLGFVASIPYIPYTIMIYLAGFIADKVRKSCISTLNTRRIAMIIALVGQAVFLVASSYCRPGQEILVIVFISFGMALSGFQYSGYIVNYIDIAPPFAGTLLGAGNTISCLAGIISPPLAAVMTPNKTQREWQTVMWMNAGILVGGTLVFVIFASGDVQEWAKPKQENTKDSTSKDSTTITSAQI